MISVTIEIPDQVASFIKDELKADPKTYLQNELINPIIEKYKKSLSEKRIAEAKTAVDKEVATAKTAMKLTLTDKTKVK